jgi:hypothetical protein
MPVRAALVASSGFGDTGGASRSPVSRKLAASPDFIPVEIVFKPRPVYTDEARRLQIEGEVLLDMLFEASGKARVIGVLRGLDHGLNESAIAAALGILFRPAERYGHPADSSAMVHIIFQLAY